jgi:hypothetical protein
VAAVVIYVVVRAPRWLVVVSVGDRHVVRWGCVVRYLVEMSGQRGAARLIESMG